MTEQDNGRVVITVSYGFNNDDGQQVARWESVFTIDASSGEIHLWPMALRKQMERPWCRVSA